jgi:hypothetical protein
VPSAGLKPADPRKQFESEDYARRTTRVVIRAYGQVPALVNSVAKQTLLGDATGRW